MQWLNAVRGECTDPNIPSEAPDKRAGSWVKKSQSEIDTISGARKECSSGMGSIPKTLEEIRSNSTSQKR